MKRERSLFGVLLLLATLAAMAGYVMINQIVWQDAIQPYGLTIALVLVLGTIVRMERFQESFTRRQLVMSGIGFVFSVMLLSLVPENYIFNWWMLGTALAAVYNLYLGLALQGILTYLLCGLYGYSVENFIYYLLIGGILCLLIHYMTSFISFIYVFVIALCANLTLIFVMNNFAWRLLTAQSTHYSLLSTGVVVILAFLLNYWNKGKRAVEDRQEKPEKKEETTEEAAAAAEEERLQEILVENFPLREKLLEHSQTLYSHSLHISSVAQAAAQYIGCRELVAQAGGLYHEIGRICPGDYVTEGERLAKEYQLPEPVIAIIRQNNLKREKPQSVEAAVVMLTDSIISTVEYMEQKKKGKPIPLSMEKLIEQIFTIRLEKGCLDEAGMDIKDYKKLKEFFRKEYQREEIK